MFCLNEIQNTEKSRMCFYAEKALFGKSHWGDGEVLIPEEQWLYDQIRDNRNIMELTFTQLKIFVSWFLEATGRGAFMIQEDISIMNKIQKCVQEHLQNEKIPDHLPEEDDLESRIEYIEAILN